MIVNIILKYSENKLKGQRIKLTLAEKVQKKVTTNLSNIGEPVKILVKGIDELVHGMIACLIVQNHLNFIKITNACVCYK